MAAGDYKSMRRYCVSCCGDGWEVVADSHYLGRFSSQADAIQQAIDWAQIDGKRGGSAQVVFEVADRDFKVAWTYGKDPYPAKR
jgi:hypothetical protein